MLHKTKHKKQNGIALLLTIILSGLMLVTAVAFTKEMLDEVKNSTRIDNSMIAYYAAEAGLERALLTWRTSDYHGEISDDEGPITSGPDYTDNPTVNVTAASEPICYSLGNIDTGIGRDTRVDKNTCLTGAGRDFRAPYFAVKMWYKANQVVNQRVNKDEVYEFEMPAPGSIVLKWDSAQKPFDDLNGTGFRVETTGYSSSGAILGNLKDFSCTDKSDKVIPSSGQAYTIFRIKPWHTMTSTNCNVDPTAGYNNNANIISRLQSDGITPAINLNIDPAGDLLIGLPVTQIESIGYYGGVARKITAQLDRTSGNIIGIFDYVIYSEADLVK